MKFKLIKATIASLILIASIMGNIANAGLIATSPIFNSPSSTNNLWQYSYVDVTGSTPISNAQSYATSLTDFSSAIFHGYVSGDWGGTSDSFNGGPSSDFTTIHTFGSYFQSSIDQTISMLFGGDDGHSLFVNDVFQAGGGFGNNKVVTVSLTANIPVYVELVGFNYGGTWGFSITENSTPQAPLMIKDISGVRMNAQGNFAEVPEPSTLAIFALGMIGLASRRFKK